MKVCRKKIYILTICLYLICLPLNAMRLGKIGSLLKIIALIPIIVGFSNGKLRVNNLLKWQTFFSFFAFISIIWSVNKDESIGRVISYIELLALLFSGSSFDFTEEELNKLKKALVWSSRTTALVLLRYGEIITGRLWLNGIIAEDPNYICAYFSFGVIFALQKIIESKRINKKIFGTVEVIFYFYLIFMSGSRGGLLAMAVAVVAYLLVKLGKTNIKKSIEVILAFCLIVLVCFSVIDYLPTQLKNRFTIADIANNGGSGRTEIWKNGLDLYIASSPYRWIFGYGTATTKYCFGYFGYSEVNVMHNMFLETLLELGIIGLIIYSVTIFKFVKEALKFKDRFTFAVIVCMVVMSLSTSIYTFKPYFNIMLFAILIDNYRHRIENK